MKIECVLEPGDIVGEGPQRHPGQERIYWPDINGFKISRDKAERAMERLLTRTSKDIQFAILRQPACGTQARHKKNEKKWCKNERRSQSLSFSGMVWQA
jgi:sugar lactone lactonase YvrE